MEDFAILRARLNQETDGAYQKFLRGLKPNYAQVWRQILLAYLALAATLALVSAPNSLVLRIAAAAVGAPLVGYFIAYLQLFMHEAAHFNLHPDRRWSDRLADLFVAWPVGGEVGRYRPLHFAHHAKLGGTEDTERSYFKALTARYLFEMLTGLHALRVFVGREQTIAGDAEETAGPHGLPWPLIRGVLIHLTILGALAAAGAWAPAAAWIVGMGVFFPFFATLRQLLEHRSAEADPRADYAAVPHGAHTRLFADGPLAATFGGVGFSRHLLHHCEPHVSYTRLADLEAFLEQTSVREVLAAHRTTYLDALAAIWRNDRR